MSGKTVVIIGGGASGASAAAALSKSLPEDTNLILVTATEKHTYLPATIRMVTRPLESEALMSYEKLFSKGVGRIVHDKATAITQAKDVKYGTVLLASGEQLQYDVLVLATGSTWEGPLAFPEDTAELDAFIASRRAEFEKATSILIVGAGAVGAEFAGEIKDLSASKKVTIVHGGSSPLNSAYPAKVRKAVDTSLRARDIELVYDDYVDTIPEIGTFTSVTTRSGKTIEADLVVNARGAKPNTQWIASLDPTVLTERGFVKVDTKLQVVGYPNVFAAGDIIDKVEQKQWAKATAHASVLAANVLAYITDKPLKSDYKGSPEIIIVTNGENGGVGYLQLAWGIVFGDVLARLLKAKGLMIWMGKGALNL